jgi:hypothetical protein
MIFQPAISSARLPLARAPPPNPSTQPQFWWASLRSLAAGLALTLFPAFDVPVFWPILVVYWAVLFSVTMRRQVAHMVKYRYVPFSLGKKAYGGGKGGGRGRAN